MKKEQSDKKIGFENRAFEGQSDMPLDKSAEEISAREREALSKMAEIRLAVRELLPMNR